MIRELILDASKSRSFTSRVGHSRLVRRASARFLPGEELDDALAAADALWEARIPALLTRLGEHVTTLGEAAEAVHHYRVAIEAVRRKQLPVDLSVKPSQLGSAFDVHACARHLREIAAVAAEAGRLVWIDMEDATTTDRTLDLFERLSADHANLGIAIQANLKRSGDDLERLLPLRPRVRLVKGAYLEDGATAHQGRRAIDESYLELAARLLSWSAAGRAEPVFGTHDLEIVQHLQELAGALGAGPHGYEVHMLYGIRAADQRRLAAEGTRVRVLVSYGPDWAAWYLRRLAERPANIVLAASVLLHGAPASGASSKEGDAREDRAHPRRGGGSWEP